MKKLSPQAREAIEWLLDNTVSAAVTRRSIRKALERHDDYHNPPEPEPLWAHPGQRWEREDGSLYTIADPDEPAHGGGSPRSANYHTGYVWVFSHGSVTCGHFPKSTLQRTVNGVKHPCAGYAPAREWGKA